MVAGTHGASHSWAVGSGGAWTLRGYVYSSDSEASGNTFPLLPEATRRHRLPAVGFVRLPCCVEKTPTFCQLQVYKLHPQFQFFVVDGCQNIFRSQQIDLIAVSVQLPQDARYTRFASLYLLEQPRFLFLKPGILREQFLPRPFFGQFSHPFTTKKTPAITQHVGVADVLFVQLFSCFF
ncbi:hypothetical protein [Cohnella cellulosilytica]|uniref:hypothetical protein n=1 Tax=Cohnella cellulosilytica TaxID=986710 RepID=UPI0035EBDBE8